MDTRTYLQQSLFYNVQHNQILHFKTEFYAFWCELGENLPQVIQPPVDSSISVGTVMKYET